MSNEEEKEARKRNVQAALPAQYDAARPESTSTLDGRLGGARQRAHLRCLSHGGPALPIAHLQ